MIHFTSSMILMLVIVQSLAAQSDPLKSESEQPRCTFTLEQALKTSLQFNQTVLSAKEYKSWGEGKYIEERAAAFPQLTLLGSASIQKDEFQSRIANQDEAEQSELFSGTATLAQPLFTWGQIGAGILAAKEGIAMAEANIKLSEEKTKSNVTEAFYDILLVKELSILAQENFFQKQRHLEQTLKHRDMGTATDYDVLAAQVAADNAKPDVIRSENAILLSRDRLRLLLACDCADVDVEGDLETSAIQPPIFEEALTSAFQNRYEIQALNHELGISNQLIKIARAGNKPRLDFQANYAWSEMQIEQDDFDGDSWSAAVSLSIPIFDGFRTRGRIIEARSDMKSTELRLEEAKNLIALEIRDAVNGMKESYEILAALRETISQAERLLQLSERGYELGVKTRLEVEDAELNLILAKSNLARAKRDYLVAATQLKYAMGISI